jgi:hypothetical protein
MWPIAYALTFEMNADDEQRHAVLVKRAAPSLAQAGPHEALTCRP